MSLSTLLTTMAPKSKLKKSVPLQTPKKKGKQASTRKAQPLSNLPPPDMGASSDDRDEEQSVNTMMNIMVDLANEEHMENLVVWEEASPQGTSPAPADTNTSRDTVRRRLATTPWHACYEAVPEILEEVEPKVSSHLKGVQATYPLTMDYDTASDEDMFIPTRCRIGIKSSKLRTADKQILKRITWPH